MADLALAWLAGVLLLQLVCIRSVKRSAARRQERRLQDQPGPAAARPVAPGDDVQFSASCVVASTVAT